MQTYFRFAAPYSEAACRARRALAIFGLLLVVLHGTPVRAFGFDDLAAQAARQAHAPYRSLSRKPPAELQALTYDQYRDIRFRPDHALWRSENLPFELMFFHLGKYQTESVRINEITPQGVRHIPYQSADFNYGKNKLSPKDWGDVGFAGFRAHYPLNGSEYKDEVAVFLGASYFRSALWLVGAGTGDRHRRWSRRRVSSVHRVLDC